MDGIEDATGQPIEEKIEPDPDPVRERFQRAIRGLDKPKAGKVSAAFRNITIKERQDRLLAVELLASEFLSPEQITDFLPAWGMNVPLSRVYTYLSVVRRPKNYKKIVERRSRRVHDGLAVHHLIRLARDAWERHLKVERILVARHLPDSPIIPDVYFFLGPYGFFIEEQIAPLPDVRWRGKLRAYIKRRMQTNDSIRVLFIVNDRSDLVRARQYARELLQQHRKESMKLFLFTEQLTMKSSQNVVSDRIWQTPFGQYLSLLEWTNLG